MSTNNDIAYYIVNDSGEILREIGKDSVRLINNDIYIMSDSPKSNDPVEKIKYNYLKVNKAIGFEMYKKCPQFYMLLPFINFKENALIFSNGTYITPTNLARHLGFSKVYMVKLFDKMRKLKIIAKKRKDNRYIYVVNPYIVMRGLGVFKSTKECFQKTEWELLGHRKGNLNEPER